MTCMSPAVTVESYDNLAPATTTGADQHKPAYKRRHSSFVPRQLSQSLALDGEEGLLLKVDTFLNELERRLEFLEEYGEVNLDAGIKQAYATLEAVRARCSEVSGSMLESGRRRAQVMVSTLESRYHDALQAQQTLAEKAHAGLLLLEDLLTDYESRALKLKQQGFSAAANQVIGGGRQMVDAGLHAAKEVMDEGINQALSAAASLEEHIAQGLARAKERGLIRFHDLPPPWQVNPHITRGYRFIHSEKKLHILLSVFGVSNETVNIWSHLIGLIIVISIAFYFYPSSANFSISTWEDKLIAAVFFFAAAKCLICSCMWHTYNCVANKTLLERFACVDYTGISFLIAASIMTTEYTAFYCEPISRWAYIATTFILGVAGVILPWHPTFNAKNMAWGRVAFYVSLALTGFVPIFQLSWTRGGAWAWHFYKPILSSIAVYGIGAVVYASKVPERWCPGMFDYVGGSHNLWHMAVLGGILFHYRAMERFFEVAFKRAGEGCIVY